MKLTEAQVCPDLLEELPKAMRRAIRDNADATRLISRARRSEAGCWEWTGHINEHGYGTMAFRSKVWKTHRVSYTIFCGEIPDGLMVCHHCDNPSCIHPSHLFLGHAKTNMRDMIRKGRGRSTITSAQDHFRSGRAPSGEEASGAKITRDDAAAIILEASNGKMTKELSKEYGLSRSALHSLLRGETWKDLPRPSNLPRKPGRQAGRRALADRSQS